MYALSASLACGPSIEEGDGGMDGTMGDGSVSDSSIDDSGGDDDAGMGSLGNGHGVVLLEIRRDDGEASDPTVDTARVEITLHYLECLIDFYEASPDWQQAGVDGSVVFDAALTTGLCDAADPSLAPCTVADITQVMAPTAMLTIGYAVTGSVEDHELRFGPLPSEDLAACAEGGLPIVRMPASGGVRGLDASGAVIWQTKTFNPAEAATDQGAPLSVTVGRD
jgi:hypothetical protein